jgi:ankyrin repeat protein
MLNHVDERYAQSPLEYACENGNLEIINFLLGHPGVKVLTQTRKWRGFGPLHFIVGFVNEASHKDLQTMIEALVKKEPKLLSCEATNGLTPLELAADEDKPTMQNIFLGQNALELAIKVRYLNLLASAPAKADALPAQIKLILKPFSSEIADLDKRLSVISAISAISELVLSLGCSASAMAILDWASTTGLWEALSAPFHLAILTRSEITKRLESVLTALKDSSSPRSQSTLFERDIDGWNLVEWAERSEIDQKLQLEVGNFVKNMEKKTKSTLDVGPHTPPSSVVVPDSISDLIIVTPEQGFISKCRKNASTRM